MLNLRAKQETNTIPFNENISVKKAKEYVKHAYLTDLRMFTKSASPIVCKYLPMEEQTKEATEVKTATESQIFYKLMREKIKKLWS